MPTDEDYGEAKRRPPDRLSALPGFPTGKLRPPPAAPRMPLPAAELESVPPAPPVAQRPLHEPHRAGQKTLVGGAPPSPQSAPEPPSAREPRSISPVPWDPAADQVERAALRRGDRIAKPSSEPPSRGEPRWWHTASGMVKVIGALTLGIPAASAATTASVVAIINALRQPTDPKLREDVEGTRREVGSLRKYLDEKDSARQLELEQRFNHEDAKIRDLDLRYPEPRVDPLRRPK